MLRKTYRTLTGMLVFCSLSAVAVVPAMAEPTNNNQTSEFTISQLRGHDIYKKAPQMNMSDYMIGTVVGQAGDVVSILLPNGTVFNTSMTTDQWGVGKYNYYGGMDVRVIEKNNAYVLVGPAHPVWIQELEAKYGLKP